MYHAGREAAIVVLKFRSGTDSKTLSLSNMHEDKTGPWILD